MAGLLRIVVLCLWPLACLAGAGADEWDDFASTDDVNEGELEFLPAPPNGPVHEHHTVIGLLPHSLADGWVDLDQCHANIDAVASAQVVFHAGRIRDLVVTEHAGIGRAWVDGPTVQLEQVGRGARLCIRAQTRALSKNARGGYVLRNGPFMRRFLDGYYPMRVRMQVGFDEGVLAYAGISPQARPGLRVWHTDGLVGYDAWFNGRLTTDISFVPKATGQ